jgi:hypothetical protein
MKVGPLWIYGPKMFASKSGLTLASQLSQGMRPLARRLLSWG